MKKILFACLLLAATASLGAQNPQPIEGKPAHHPKRITPETIAQSKTDKMRETLSLTEKQCKKLYKLKLQEAQEQQAKHSPRPGSNVRKAYSRTENVPKEKDSVPVCLREKI